MSWQNLKLGGKLSVAFSAITVILFVVATWSIINISGIVDNAEVMIKGNELRTNLEYRYIQHLKWAAELTHFINDFETKELNLETDHTKCDFGKWYYGDGRKKAEELAPALKPIFDEFAEPHKELHASSTKIAVKAMKEIADKIQIINDIAFQTNLLALNAASSEEMASGSEELAGQTEQLKKLISFFRVGDAKFEKIANISVDKKNKNKLVDNFELPDHNLPEKIENQSFKEEVNVMKDKKNKGVVISFDDYEEDDFEVFR